MVTSTRESDWSEHVPLTRRSAVSRASLLRRLARHRTAMAGLVILAVMLAGGLVGPHLIARSPVEVDFNRVLQPPSRQHVFGTDNLGRDLFTRILYGTRVSFFIGVLAVVLSMALGVPVGLFSGYYGGRPDQFIQRMTDILLAFPGILLALTLISVLGIGIENVIVSVGVGAVPVYVRLVRGTVLTIRELDYVEAARAIGMSDRRIILRHVLPNALPPIIVQSTLQVGTAILLAAGLGFLGLGVQPPTPEWGTMIGEGQTYIFSSWYLEAFPGLATFLAVMAFNLLGDGLRDALDPRLTIL
ncbi:MAG: ABC transporter permease [Armatimonadetes bacterium]|nr:ABC transporter permease [Armatimonadota bacterium]